MPISEAGQRKVFARSGNRCAFIDCRRLLTADGSPPDRVVQPKKQRFEATVALVDEKLRLLGDRDHPPDYVVIGLPNEILRRCRVAEYYDPELGLVHRDLRT